MIHINIIYLVLVLGLLIFIHELGHFLTAKWSDVKVHEFALGMGPAIFKKKFGETLYALRIFPIGGYVKMEGEDDDSNDDRAFNRKPKWKRFIILFSGGFMNILFGFIIMLIMTSFAAGFYSNTLASVAPEETVFQVNDKILEVDHQPVFISVQDIPFILARANIPTVDVKVQRNGKTVEIEDFNLKNIDGRYSLGVKIADLATENKTFFTVMKYSVLQTVSISRLIWVSLIDLVSGRVGLDQLQGPVGISQELGKGAQQGFDVFFMLVAFITINLGIMNLLPLPALDGGRIIFVLIETVRRKPIKAKYEGVVHFIGLALLMMLMIFVLYNDIIRLIFKKG